MLVATSAWFAQGALTGGPGGSGVGEWLASLQTLNGAEPTLLPAIAWMGLVSGAAVLWGETSEAAPLDPTTFPIPRPSRSHPSRSHAPLDPIPLSVPRPPGARRRCPPSAASLLRTTPER